MQGKKNKSGMAEEKERCEKQTKNEVKSEPTREKK